MHQCIESSHVINLKHSRNRARRGINRHDEYGGMAHGLRVDDQEMVILRLCQDPKQFVMLTVVDTLRIAFQSTTQAGGPQVWELATPLIFLRILRSFS